MALERPTYILLDTNVGAHETRLLQTKEGKKLAAFLRTSGCKLLLPQVLVDEYVKHFGEITAANVSRIEGAMSVLKSLWGSELTDELPRRTSHDDAARRHIDGLLEFSRVVPLAAEHKEAFIVRSMAGRAPAGGKDGLIWEAVLSLEPGSLVYFASKDVNAFFGQDRRTFSPALLEEARGRGIEVKGFGANANDNVLPAVLSALRSDFSDLKPWPEPQADDFHPVRGRLSAPADLNLPVALPAAIEAPPLIETVPANAAADELSAFMASRRSGMELAEMKALGYVTFLEGDSKEKLLNLLQRGGLEATPARNALERLVLMGLVKESDHYYLPVASPASDMAIQLVADELMALLREKS